MKHLYTIEGRLAGANEVISAMNKHRYAGAKVKTQETKRCALWAITGGVPKFTKPVDIHFHWFEPNKKRDKDNIRYGSKFILDGLREAGKLPNDGWAWIGTMSDSFDVDKENPRIEVTIEEC